MHLVFRICAQDCRLLGKINLCAGNHINCRIDIKREASSSEHLLRTDSYKRVLRLQSHDHTHKSRVIIHQEAQGVENDTVCVSTMCVAAATMNL